MTPITIPLHQGDNYISFPATSVDNFETIFTNAGIINNIPENGFLKLNPITKIQQPVLYTEYIVRGTAYDLYINEPAQLTYDGIEYTMTFDQLKSHLLHGWNFIGIGSNTITPSGWCKILDSDYNTVTMLEPKNAYWIYYDDCMQPSGASIGEAIGFTVSCLFLIYMLKEFKVLK